VFPFSEAERERLEQQIEESKKRFQEKKVKEAKDAEIRHHMWE